MLKPKIKRTTSQLQPAFLLQVYKSLQLQPAKNPGPFVFFFLSETEKKTPRKPQLPN